MKGKLIIYEVNHLDELNYSTNIKEFLKKKIIRFAVKYLYKYPDLVATNSKESTRDLAKFIKRKVYTLPNPCFKKITNIKRTLKPHKKINILNISRFENQKDHLTLLKAVNSSGIKDKINLILVGYGRNYHNIKRFIKENKINAKIFLKKTNLKKFYINSDLYICSSLYEGLPTTVVEAASYCLPIISSDFKSGIKEILKNGKTGTFFKKRDHKKLSKLILSYYLNPKPFLQKEYLCRKYLHKFSINESTSVLNKFLNKIS